MISLCFSLSPLLCVSLSSPASISTTPFALHTQHTNQSLPTPHTYHPPPYEDGFHWFHRHCHLTFASGKLCRSKNSRNLLRRWVADRTRHLLRRQRRLRHHGYVKPKSPSHINLITNFNLNCNVVN